MKTEGRRDQQDPWRKGGDGHAGGCQRWGKIAAAEVETKACVVAERLGDDVDIFAGFDLDDDEAAGVAGGEQVSAMVLGAEGSADLTAEGCGLDGGVNHLDVLAHHAFEPALGVKPVEGVAGVRGGSTADASDASGEALEPGGGGPAVAPSQL